MKPNQYSSQWTSEIEKEKEYVDIANKRIEEHQEKAIGTLI